MDSGYRSVRHGRRAAWRRGLPVLLALLCFVSTTTRAQSREEIRYTFAFVGVPLDDALARLLNETRMSLVYETHLTAGRTAYCRAERVPAEALLGCILNDTGLDFIRLSSGTYVLVEAPEAAPLYASLTGQVIDAVTGMPLADASVLLANERTGAATNRDGRFAFPALRPGPHRLIVTHVAYHDAADTVYVGPAQQRRHTVALAPRIILTAPVVVSGFETRLPSDELGSGRRPAGAATTMQGVGMQDLVQDLDAVVGVRLGDALSDVHVQGGASNEQQFLLDGVPIFMPVPNGGFIGPFSPFATGQVTVRKAGFGASHGSGLSGVIEVEHGLTSSEAPRLTVQVDPLSLNARWNGRTGLSQEAEATWMLALRHGLWDLYQPHRLETLFRRWATPDRFLFDTLWQPEEPLPDAGSPAEAPTGPLEVGFDDVHAAARVRLGGLRSLHGSFYQGTGRFGIDDVAFAGTNEDAFEDAYHWRNRTGQLRYEWVQSRRLFLHAAAWTTGYRLANPVSLHGSTAPIISSDDFNEIDEIGLRLGGDLAASPRHQMTTALEATHTSSDFALSLDPFGEAPSGPAEIQPVVWRVAAFAEDRLAFGQGTTLTLGTRLTYLPEQQTLYAEPRLALQHDRAAGRGTLAVRGAVGLYRQFLHSFDVATYNAASLLPRMRFWLPVGRRQRPPEAYHATLGLRYRPLPAWEFGVETYYKHQPHLLVLDYGSRAEAGQTGEVLRDADGYAYGAAFTAARKGQRLQVAAQYEYDLARRRVANRFGRAWVPVPWDAPHRLHLALDLIPFPRWTATVRWQGVFGRSWGFRQAYYDFLEPDPALRAFPPFDLSDPAAHRLPAFSQLDAGLAYTRRIKGVGMQARLHFINLLGRGNVTDWSLGYDESTDAFVKQPRRATAFLPSFSLRLSL